MTDFLEDLDQPSYWTQIREAVFERPMGLLERRFDLGSSDQGRSDTLARVFVDCPSPAVTERLLKRLPLAWFALRAQLPTLCLTSHACDNDDMLVHGRQQRLYPRKFRYVRPASLQALWEQSQNAFSTTQLSRALFDELVLKEELEIRNDPTRRFLSHERCLAHLRLFVDKHRRKMAVFLIISHTISDGMAVMRILKDLFGLAGDASLPIPASTSTVSEDVLRRWAHDSLADVVDRLPLSSESLFPPVPRRRRKTRAAERWFWAVERVRMQVRAKKRPRAPQFERKHPIGDKRAHSYWLPLTIDRVTTSKLVRMSREARLSPSMMMYAIIATALSNVLHRHGRTSQKLYQPIIIGFPFSLRPFLDIVKHPDVLSDAAIRITFGQIVLPFDPCEHTSVERLRRIVKRGATDASAQFARRFRPDERSRERFLASCHLTNADLLRRTLGVNDDPIDEPKSVLNVSMVGDLDRLLPSSYGEGDLHFELRDMSVGTRLHVGEGMLTECWTWRGEMTISLGTDDLVFELAQAQEILDEVKLLVLSVTATQSQL